MKTMFTNSRKVLTMLGLLAIFGLQAPGFAADTEISELVVFGDGYSDTGNSFNHSMATAGIGLPPTPAYFDGRASNGPVWIEHLASWLDLPAPEPTMTGGTNYAWLGAGTSPDGSAPGIPDIGGQIDSYLSLGNVPNEDQLFVFWAGLGDFLNAGDGVFAVPDPSALVQRLVGHIEAIADAADSTASLKILVANLPPLGQTVRSRWLGDNVNPEIPQLFDRLTVQVNALLSSELKLLARDRGIEIIELDVFGLSREISADPLAFGFTNVSDPARVGTDVDAPPADVTATETGIVPSPDDHVFYDDVYPTRKWHEVLAGRALDEVLAGNW